MIKTALLYTISAVNIRKVTNLIIVLFLTVFIIFSVHGAFLGANRAKIFFNSPAQIVFWCLLLLFMLLGFVVYAALRKRISLLLIHLGFVLVLAGGMMGSDLGLDLTNRMFNDSVFPRGMIQLQPGQSTNLVATGSDGIAELPFFIRLKDAYLDYYDTAVIRFHVIGQNAYDIPAKEGETITLSDDLGTVTVAKAYSNFKLRKEEGAMVPYDSNEPGSNPAWELVLTAPGGQTKSYFVFERIPMHPVPHSMFHAEYLRPQMVKDYKSTLEVIDENKVVKETTIEVNKPLYYGGYHFYQNTFAFNQAGPVSGIEVTSSRGVWTVFIGYGLIFLGLVSRFWTKLHNRSQSKAAGGLQ